jgi:hypothetical protein
MVIEKKITENFNTLPKFPDCKADTGTLSAQQIIEYMGAMQRWTSVLGFQLTSLLEEIKNFDPDQISYYSGQRDILKAILGVE